MLREFLNNPSQVLLLSSQGERCGLAFEKKGAEIDISNTCHVSSKAHYSFSSWAGDE
jgi:hypothetical protein